MTLPIAESECYQNAVAEAVRIEREACARVAENPEHIAVLWDEHDAPWADGQATLQNVAAAIRSRGGQEG